MRHQSGCRGGDAGQQVVERRQVPVMCIERADRDNQNHWRAERPLFRVPARNPAAIAPLTAVGTFVAIGILHWPLPLVLLVIVPVNIGVAFRNIEARR
jgi:hypothetical protein